MFGHQYQPIFNDLRGMQDAYMRERGIDYFENSRRATLSQRAYANDNPGHWKDSGGDIWGLTASDGPGDVTVYGTRYIGCSSRGAAPSHIRQAPTLSPPAALSSLPSTPPISHAPH